MLNQCLEDKAEMDKKYLLLVDDDDVCHFINTTILRRSGLTVPIVTALSGLDAIDLVKSRHLQGELPIMIFVDLNMPSMNGFEFIDQLRSMDKPLSDTKVIIVSSSVHPKDLRKAVERGVRFITKPISSQECFDIFLSIEKIRRFA